MPGDITTLRIVSETDLGLLAGLFVTTIDGVAGAAHRRMDGGVHAPIISCAVGWLSSAAAQAAGRCAPCSNHQTLERMQSRWACGTPIFCTVVADGFEAGASHGHPQDSPEDGGDPARSPPAPTPRWPALAGGQLVMLHTAGC